MKSLANKLWLAAAFWLSLPAMGAFALKTTPDIIEPGDTGVISIPIRNQKGGIDVISNMRLEVFNKSVWINILDTSFKGPIDVYPGERMTFTVEWEIASNYDPNSPAGEIDLRLISDSPRFVPSGYTWRFVTENGFKTMHGVCVDNTGVSCAEYISSDKLPPKTNVSFNDREYIDAQGHVYISAVTPVSFDGYDTYESNTEISRVAVTGYKLGAQPVNFEGLTPINEFITLSEGQHTLYFASRDYAGNIEVIKSSTIYVDGTAPISPASPKAAGGSPSPWQNTRQYSLTWTNPPDVSGVAGVRIKYGGTKPVSNDEGTFYPADNSLDYSAPDAINGLNPIWLWLEDNVGNADPATAVQVSLRYDGIPPASNASVQAINGVSLVNVPFTSSDEGAAGDNPTGSGVSRTVLWSGYPSEWCRWIGPGKYYCGFDGPVRWSSSTYVQTGTSGSFSFTTDKEGDWYFYTQAYDAAGNAELVPVSTTPAKGRTYVDITPPAISNIKASAFSSDSASIEWTTDDLTTTKIDYGRSTTLGTQYTETVSTKTHKVTLTGLPNPADIYYKITATNKTGLATASEVGSFKTPLDIDYTTDIFGVIDYSQPVTLFITNPDINSATLVIDGQTWSGTVNPSEPVQIYVDPNQTGGGTHGINVTADGYGYSSNFVVDTATRTVKLARLVVSDGGLMSNLEPDKSAVDMTTGQGLQTPMSNGISKFYLGYYAGIDPVAPAAISDLAVTPGPEPGQVSLTWTAPGDDANVGTAMKYEIRYSTESINAGYFTSAALAADIPLPQPPGTTQTLLISGLGNGKNYHFAVKTLDELLNESLSNIPTATTLQVAQGAPKISGKPAVEVISNIPDLTVAPVPAGSQNATVLAARSAAPGQSLTFFSDIYEILPSMQLTQGATVQFRFEEMGADAELELAVYKYNPTLSQWVMLPGPVDTGNNVINAVTYTFSLFAILARDTKPPVTDIIFTGGNTYTDTLGDIYISSKTLLGFTTNDPLFGGKPASGVKETDYRLDSSTAQFIIYTGAFPPGDGFHSLQYRSIDNAGNAEQAKQSSIRIDALPPVITYAADKSATTLKGKMIVSAASCVLTINVTDPATKGAASGVKYASAAIDGAPITAGEGGLVKQLAAGAHHVIVWAEDNLGNRTDSQIDIFVAPDTLSPRSALGTLEMAYQGAGVYYITARSSLTLTSADDLTASGDGTGGVRQQNVKVYSAGNLMREGSFINPAPEQGGNFISTFSLAAWGLPDGAYSLEYTAEDLLGNAEPAHQSAVAMDDLPPDTAAQFSGATNDNGWHVTPVETTLVSTDALSGVQETRYSLDAATYTLYASRFMIAQEGGHSLKYYAADFLGNTESEKSAYVKLDLSSPTIQTAVIPAPNTYGWNNSSVDVVFTGSDTISGLVSCSPGATINEEGAGQQVSVTCFDNAGLSSTRTVSVSIDTTQPSILYTQTPAANEYGWNNSDAALKFTCADDLAGVKTCPADMIMGGEGENISTSAVATDYADNFRPISVTGIKIDRTLPVSTAAVSGIYRNGWYASPVDVTFASTDSLSGIKDTLYSVNGGTFTSYQQIITISADGGTTVRYYARDKAGNAEAERAVSFSVDRTAPQVSYTLSPAPNSNGWNRSAVEAVFSGTDNLSGVDICVSSKTYIEGPGKTLASWCRDKAGNIGYSTAVVNIDVSSPIVSVAASPTANSFGWNNTPVTVAFSGYDAVSSNSYCTADKVFSSEGLGQSITGTCMDYAGNSRSVSFTVSIDTTTPVTKAEFFGTPVNGWYNAEVSIALVPLDALSGVRQTSYRLERGGVLVSSGVYASSITASADGFYALYYYTMDKADNIEFQKSVSFRIDRTLPVVSYSIVPAPNVAGWNNTSVAVIFTGTDTLSGVAECSSTTVSTEGLARAVPGWCRDVAGNMGYSTATLNIDLTRPITSATQTPAPNARGWNNAPVAVRVTGTDVLSGVSYCAPDKLISVEGSSQSISGYCMDYAGNSSTATLTLNIDRTAPVIAISSPSAGQIFIATRGDIRIGFTMMDILDPAPAMEAYLIQTEDRGSPRGSRPGIVAVTNGQSIEPLNIDDGMWRLTVGATDFADNAAYLAGGVFEVIHDMLPPRTAQSISGGPQHTAGVTTYIRKDTELKLASIDDLVTAGDAIGLGVARQTLAIKAGEVSLRALAFTNQRPEQGAVFVSTFSLDREADGVYSLHYGAGDALGNAEITRINSVAVDNTAPASAHHIGSPYYAAGTINYIAPATPVGFTAEDPVIGTVAAGVARMETAVDAGQWQTFTQALKLNEGRHTIKYRAIDNVGNTEAEKMLEVQSDNTAPVSGFVASGQYYESAGRKYAPLSFTYSFTAEDPVVSSVTSGVKLSEYRIDHAALNTYNTPFSLTEGIRLIEYRSQDNVSNTELLKSATVYVDNTAPVTAHHIGSPYYGSGGINYITPATPIMFSADDPIIADMASGVKRIEVSLDGGGYAVYSSALTFPEGKHTIKYRTIDNVGNTEAEKTLAVQSDNTSPVSGWLAASGSWIEKDSKFYLNASGTIAFESADPVVNNVAAGLEGIYYGINAAATLKSTAAFGLVEGVRTLNYSAKDNVGNIEVVKSTVIYVDGTAPVSTLGLYGDQYNGDRQFISQRTDILITAEDPAVNTVAVGIKEIKYAVDGGEFADYASFKLDTEGKRRVSYYSADLVNNVEAAKTAELWVDATPPATALTISGARYLPPGSDTLHVTKDSGIVLTSTDPVVAETSSGVMMIKYRLDAGEWRLYQGSFTITAEGNHIVEYYGTDRVMNAENPLGAKIAVDITPPVSAISIGEPKYEVFGLPVLTPETPVTLSAFDPVANKVASGLNNIYYELENAQTGVRASVATYLEPFKLAQGAFIIRYWSKDNVTNTETPNALRVSVMKWREDGLAAVSGLGMSGTADITGTVKSNAVVSVSGNARIVGDVTASTITVTGKALITGQKTPGAIPLDPEPIYMPDIVQRVAAMSDNSLLDRRNLTDGKLVLGSKTGITISTGIYYLKGLETAAGSSITIAGKVDILVDGEIKISGGSSINADGPASNLNIFVSTASTVDFTGGANFLACLYAPYSHMKLAGNAVLGGHYFVKTAAVTGTGNYVQSGESLPQIAIVTADSGGKKKAAAIETGSPDTKVLAGPDPIFKLNEAYVFPNPAKGGEKPVFHVEVGIADSVKITVYTVSGRVAHERTLAGLPIALDDGNGLAYAYEYTWDGHIPSGVYYYLVEAAKAGQKIRKTGKFAVIR